MLPVRGPEWMGICHHDQDIGLPSKKGIPYFLLELWISFVQVKVSRTMKEKQRQVRNAICVNWREIAHMRLEAIAGADNLYSLITIYGRDHLAIKAGGAVYSQDTHQWRSSLGHTRIALKRYPLFLTEQRC